MPSSKVVADMVSPLKLLPDEMQMIIDDAERILTETLAACDLFVSCDRTLPQDKFKLTKTKEHIQVYRSRKPKRSGGSTAKSVDSSGDKPKMFRSRADTIETTLLSAYDYTASGSSALSSRSSSSSSASSYQREVSSGSSSSGLEHRSMSSGSSSSGLGHRSESISSVSSSSTSRSSVSSAEEVTPCDKVVVELNRTKPVDRSYVIAVGIIVGTVDDVAFGMLAHTERLWRHRDAHLGDQFTAAKVLATITRPTPESPFNTLTVKWCAKNVGVLARTRDCVFIEANGVATCANGERVAYNLVHSLDSLPRIPSFKHLDIVRVNLSTCYLTRQHDQSSVEVFCRGFADQGGSFSDGCMNNVYADMVLSIVHVVDCAYVKKLVWLAHKKREHRYASGSFQRGASSGSLCANCGATFNVFSSLVGCATPCQSCSREVCCKCSVSKKVEVETASNVNNSYTNVDTKMKSVVFCVHCVIEATRTPTADVASGVLLGDDIVSIRAY